MPNEPKTPERDRDTAREQGHGQGGQTQQRDERTHGGMPKTPAERGETGPKPGEAA